MIVEKNNYSKLGPFSHIELFSMSWHLENRFKYIIDKKNIIALTSYTEIYDDKIVDPKSQKTILLDKPLFIYNTNLDLLQKIKKQDLIDRKKKIKEVRHWSQLLDKKSIIIKFIIFLNPRLDYLF